MLCKGLSVTSSSGGGKQLALGKRHSRAALNEEEEETPQGDESGATKRIKQEQVREIDYV